VAAAQAALAQVTLAEPLVDYIVALVRDARQWRSSGWGQPARGGLAGRRGAGAGGAGRARLCHPDDIKAWPRRCCAIAWC
jgi:MoxR-like ATPase